MLGEGQRAPPKWHRQGYRSLQSQSFQGSSQKEPSLAGALSPGHGSHQPSAAGPPLRWGAAPSVVQFRSTPVPAPDVPGHLPTTQTNTDTQTHRHTDTQTHTHTHTHQHVLRSSVWHQIRVGA